MYKNLSPSAIGILARQSELLEIVLTHRFKGLEIDIQELMRRAQVSSVAQACRYLCSAQVRIGGFELPMRWTADDKAFQEDLQQLALALEICQQLKADRCYTTIRPTSDQLPFHENFQFHVQRLQKVADALAPGGVKLALNFLAAPADRNDGGFQFIHQVDPLLLLVNAIQRENVGLLLDAWQWWVGGGDADKVRSLRGDQVLSVRLADIPAGTDLATITEEQRLMPGDGGLIDSAALLAALEDIGFDGPVAVAPFTGLFKGQKREATVRGASTALDTVLGPITADKPVAAASQG
jgi:sugar phosphate isomerase/epimerase